MFLRLSGVILAFLEGLSVVTILRTYAPEARVGERPDRKAF